MAVAWLLTRSDWQRSPTWPEGPGFQIFDVKKVEPDFKNQVDDANSAEWDLQPERPVINRNRIGRLAARCRHDENEQNAQRSEAKNDQKERGQGEEAVPNCQGLAISHLGDHDGNIAFPTTFVEFAPSRARFTFSQPPAQRVWRVSKWTQCGHHRACW
jgi:hypothetical protein